MQSNHAHADPIVRYCAALCLSAALWSTPGAALAAADETVAAPAKPSTELLISVISGREMAALRHRKDDQPQTDSATQRRTYRTHSHDKIRQVRVLAGHSAYISHSQAIPYPAAISGPGHTRAQPDFALEYRELKQGFAVRPRFDGGQLLLDISASNEHRSDHGGGIIDGTSIQTTIAAEPGQWIRLGGLGGLDPPHDENPGAYRVKKTAGRGSEDETWVRVELIQ